jgi:peptidoglycan-N-acetylglucosamine deacetylase
MPKSQRTAKSRKWCDNPVSLFKVMLSRVAFAFLLLANLAAGQNTDQQLPHDASQRPGPPISPSTPSAPKVTFSSVHVSGPYVAMTFDDGPNPTLTPKLLDILAQRKMKATFFVLGENAERYPEILKRAVAEGHEIGNHTWSHPNLATSSEDTVRSQLQRTDDLIRQIIGFRPRIMRPPYGALTSKQRQWVHEQFGYDVILWEVDPLDWKEPGPAIVARRIISQTKPGFIILSHDIHAQTIAAMPQTFDALLAKGFKFVTVSELLALAESPPLVTTTATPASR